MVSRERNSCFSLTSGNSIKPRAVVLKMGLDVGPVKWAFHFNSTSPIKINWASNISLKYIDWITVSHDSFLFDKYVPFV